MSAVSVHFIGSGDAFGSGGRFQTCLLLQSDSERILVDCGASSLVALKRAGIQPSTIGTILITHLHGDHFGGIPFFVLDAQFSKRTESRPNPTVAALGVLPNSKERDRARKTDSPP